MAKKTRDFSEVIRAKVAADPVLAEAIAEESLNADIAQNVHDLRIGAGLTQKKLAELIGTHQSAISRIEDANYEGHSLGVLLRIAFVLGKRLRVAFHPLDANKEAVSEEFLVDWTASSKPLMLSTQDLAVGSREIFAVGVTNIGSPKQFSRLQM